MDCAFAAYGSARTKLIVIARVSLRASFKAPPRVRPLFQERIPRSAEDLEDAIVRGSLPVWVKLRRTQYEHMFSALLNNGHRTSASPAHQIRDSCHRWITEQHGQQLNQTAVPAPAMCRANLQRPVAQSIYSRRRSTDQSGAGLFATARTLLVLSASLKSFASRLFFGALKTCLRLRPRSTNDGLVMWWGLIVSLVFVYVYPAIEMVEEWRLRLSAEKDRAQMRMHAASGHRCDVTRGQWVA